MRQAARLFGPVAASTSDATLYTAPALTTVIIRLINVANTSAGNVTFSLAIGGTAATAANCIYSGVAVAANTTTPIYGPFVLAAGETLHGLAGATSITFEASGDLSVAGG